MPTCLHVSLHLYNVTTLGGLISGRSNLLLSWGQTCWMVTEWCGSGSEWESEEVAEVWMSEWMIEIQVMSRRWLVQTGAGEGIRSQHFPPPAVLQLHSPSELPARNIVSEEHCKCPPELMLWIWSQGLVRVGGSPFCLSSLFAYVFLSGVSLELYFGLPLIWGV